jgi:poly(3-hydroxybutyrate) depolymerase
VLAIHGRDDDVNPYDGGDGLRWPTGIHPTMQSWAARWGGSAPPRVRELESGVLEQRFDDPAARFGGVRLVTLDQVGHGWPGTRDALCLRQFGPAGTWSATSHLGRYFAEFDRRPAGIENPDVHDAQRVSWS